MSTSDISRSGKPAVVAHRGASADRPEHTLAAYELALQEGADGVECDVRLTRDGLVTAMSTAPKGDTLLWALMRPMPPPGASHGILL